MRRTWQKLHLGIDETTGEIISAVATTNDYHDSEVLGNILDGVESEILQVSGDGAYDTKGCYESIQQRQARVGIPPRKNATVRVEQAEPSSAFPLTKIQQHDNCNRLIISSCTSARYL